MVRVASGGRNRSKALVRAASGSRSMKLYNGDRNGS